MFLCSILVKVNEAIGVSIPQPDIQNSDPDNYDWRNFWDMACISKKPVISIGPIGGAYITVLRTEVGPDHDITRPLQRIWNRNRSFEHHEVDWIKQDGNLIGPCFTEMVLFFPFGFKFDGPFRIGCFSIDGILGYGTFNIDHIAFNICFK